MIGELGRILFWWLLSGKLHKLSINFPNEFSLFAHWTSWERGVHIKPKLEDSTWLLYWTDATAVTVRHRSMQDVQAGVEVSVHS